MNETELDLKELIIEVLNLEDVGPDDIDSVAPLFGDGLGLDSIDALELGVAIRRPGGGRSAPAGNTRIRPLMPRWTSSTWPSSNATSRYFARRSIPVTLRPASRVAKSAGNGNRNAGTRVSTACSTCPSRAASRPWRVVSTSGSSGIGFSRLVLLALHSTIGLASAAAILSQSATERSMTGIFGTMTQGFLLPAGGRLR